MNKDRRPHRCAQCGRTYTKAQWSRSNFWCPTCRKFVCQECVSRGSICPACGTKTNRRAQQGVPVFASIGAMFMLMSVLMLFVGLKSRTALMVGAFMMGLGLSLIMGSIVFFTTGRKRARIHQEVLSAMPRGTIPLEERPGYGDLNVQRMWMEANLPGSLRRMPAASGTYPEHMYYGLKGDWDLPVMTREQRISMTAGTQRKGLAWGLGFVGMGIFLIAVAIFTFWVVEMFLAGVMFILVGSLVAVIARYAEQWVKSDAEVEVKVFWKTVGFRTAKAAVEEFLEEQGLDAKLRKTALGMSQHPEHTYELLDGNKISFTYSEDRSGNVYGWVEIVFRPAGALAARRLQMELDEYLCERDLVGRVG